MSDRFDLEQAIMECWSVTNDIQNFYHVSEEMTPDQRQNYLLGLEAIYEVKFEKLWKIFGETIHNKLV